MIKSPVVCVSQGQLQGRVVNSPSGTPFYSFQGIPYAKPPLGALRFKDPQPAEPWEGIRDATSEGNVCPQIDFIFEHVYVGDEDCLFLNVYTPDINGSLPVMFWIHGGGFRWGYGDSKTYGPDYLIEKDVVVVTINYRCGPLGFLCLNTPEVPGNAGLKDQIQALRWVKENIHKFGGDPNKITIFGESAGGFSTSILTASPLSKNLISGAIMESGNGLCSWGVQDDPVDKAKILAKQLGYQSEDIDQVLKFLRAAPVKDLIEGYDKINPNDDFTRKTPYFCCVVEKEFPGVEAVITEPFFNILTSGRTADVPIMIGRNALELPFEIDDDDFQAYIPLNLKIERYSPQSKALIEKIKNVYLKGKPKGPENLTDRFQLLSDCHFSLDTYRYVRHAVQTSKRPVYFYRFDHFGALNFNNNKFNKIPLTQAMHMDELGYLFKNVFHEYQKPTPEDLQIMEVMVRLWTNFAKYGNPTPKKDDYLTTTWLPATKETTHYLNIATELTLLSNPDKERMDFWEEVYSKHFKA